jgi:hypothetical protein
MKQSAIVILVLATFAHAGDRPHSNASPAQKETVVDVPMIINTHLEEAWKKNNLTVSPRATDHEFIRRATLDIIGRSPTPSEIRKFLAMPEDQRRQGLCDRLVESSEFAEYQADRWAHLLLDQELPQDSSDTVTAVRNWLAKLLKKNEGWDKITTEILTSRNNNNGTPSAAQNFYQSASGQYLRDERFGDSDMVPATNRVSRLFLGMRVECSQCHNDFFDPRFTQQRYWEFNALFREASYNSKPKKLADHIYFQDTAGQSYTAYPKFLDGADLDLSKYPTRRHALAASVVRSDEFAQALVNRYWGALFGAGLNNSEELDTLSLASPPLYPELMRILGNEVKRAEYKPREVVRWLCKSKPYSLSSIRKDGEPDEPPHFNFMRLRPLNDFQLQRAIGSSLELDPVRHSAKAITASITTRESRDENDRVILQQAVGQWRKKSMMTSPLLQSAIESWAERIGVEEPELAVRTAFLSILGREANETERARFVQMVKSTSDLADLGWALINSAEFELNY